MSAARSGKPAALVLRALGLGDFLTGVPALRMLRTRLPDHHLVLAAPHPLAPLVELSECVDELLPTGELQPLTWDRPPPDVAVDLHGNGIASRRLLAVLHPERLIGFTTGSASELPGQGPLWVTEEHEVDRWCRLVAESLGPTPGRPSLRLARPRVASPEPGAVVVHPGAASGSRRWPTGRFAAVARHLGRLGHRVVITGSPSERDLVEDVREGAGLHPSAALCHLGLLELAALVADARLVVCGDTGVGHLASAYATPSVLLFGPTPPERWGPPREGPHRVLWHGTGPGDPHAAALDPALARITVAEVIDAVDVSLTAGGGGPSGAAPARRSRCASRPASSPGPARSG